MAANISTALFRRLIAEGRIIFADDPVTLVEARFEDSKNEPARKVLWTDASAIGTTVGVAVVWKRDFDAGLQRFAASGEQEWTENYFVSRMSQGSDSGEKEGVWAALVQGEELFVPGTVGDIVVYTDTDIQSMKSPSTIQGRLNPLGGPATRVAVRAVELALKGFTVEIKGCRGHVAILGNELADYWARRAIGLGRPSSGDDWMRASEAVRRRDERKRALAGLREAEEFYFVTAAQQRPTDTTTTTLTAAATPAITDATPALTEEQQQQQMEADLAELEAFVAGNE
ncbi:hypothetical protein SLS58_003262 [Diplodia intermedia]|uniref:RNase H type-1 domain-containing protein n=1 Tax=Diplodia intermedia TaxID=856260 RepID=A0ABR3TWG6_9PEZI